MWRWAVADAEEDVRRAQQRAADQLGKIMRRNKRPQRSVRIPVFTSTPAFKLGVNLWLDPDGNLRSYGPDGTVYQYTKTTVTAHSGSLPADPQPETLTKTYAADWGQTYCAIHGVETGTPGIWYGDSFDGAHVGRKIMLGFPDSTIRTDTAGATIEKVELTANNLDAAQANVYLHWGLHNSDTAPGSYAAMRKDAYLNYWPRVGPGDAAWRRVHRAFGEWFRDDAAKGLTMDQPAGAGNSGQLDWASVKLRITYTK